MKTVIKTPVTVEKVVERVTEERSEIVDVPGGPGELLETNVYVQCTSYAYTGILKGVNDSYIEIMNPHIVYMTGAWSRKTFETAEALPTKKLVLFQSQIEGMFTIDRWFRFYNLNSSTQDQDLD